MPQTAIPIVSTAVPSTIVASLVPNVPLRAGTFETTTTSTQQTEDLIKSMEEMKIQATEIHKLKEKVTRLEYNYEIS